MAYIRSKEINGNRYLYLQEAYREDGRVRTRHVAYIGKNISPAFGSFKDGVKTLYGTTSDPAKAGFITKDGKYIDFSEGTDRRTLDHHALILPEFSDTYSYESITGKKADSDKDYVRRVVEDKGRSGKLTTGLRAYGLIRFNYDRKTRDMDIQVERVPTASQMQAIRKAKAETVYIDFPDPTAGGQYDSPAKAYRDLLDKKNYRRR